ncbi:MAG: hypothetical protein KGI00_01275 [Candidatus Micrarchaeota archaeon]|nr:hypothetical protein [Candidatus Micrarchaeota archaeon]MDE1824093.1 hypothetical protein [Candidatus Micrarchaeota archaeon]MDE1849340.1 hypothetical protein [Candidatus Micrarchaeota archaeon]
MQMRNAPSSMKEATSAELTAAVRSTFEGISASFEKKFRELHSNGYGKDKANGLWLFQVGSTLYSLMKANCGVTINDPSITDYQARKLVDLGTRGKLTERIESYIEDFRMNLNGNANSLYAKRTMRDFESMVLDSLGRMGSVSQVISGSSNHDQLIKGIGMLSDEIDALSSRINFFRHETLVPRNGSKDNLIILLRPAQHPDGPTYDNAA